MLLEMLQLPPEQIKGPYCPATSKIGLVTPNGQRSRQDRELSSGNSGVMFGKGLMGRFA